MIGGYVYRGKILPAWWGIYIYGDFCTGDVWGLWPDNNGGWHNELLFKTDAFISSFGEDQAGEIYMLSINGKIYQLSAK